MEPGGGRPGRTFVFGRALVSVALGVLLAMFGLTARAGAGDAYIFDCGFVLEPPVIATDDQVHIIGSGFEPGSTVDFFIDDVFLGTAEVGADLDGNIDVTFDLPPAFQTDGA